MGNAMAAAGNVTSLCGACSGQENYDRNTIDATMAQHNLQRAKWHETPAAHTASNSPPNLAMPRGPAIMMQPDARQAKGIMKSPRPMLSDDDRQRVKMLLENDEEMDTEAYQAVLDNMTIDDTTHHFGPLTEDADVYGMRTEDDLTIMDDFSESLALKSARSNKNVSFRDSGYGRSSLPAVSERGDGGRAGNTTRTSDGLSYNEGTDTRWADSEAQNSQLMSNSGNRSEQVRKRLAAQSRKYLRNAENKKFSRSADGAGAR